MLIYANRSEVFRLGHTSYEGLGLPSAIFESYDQLRRDTAQEFGLQKAQAEGRGGSYRARFCWAKTRQTLCMNCGCMNCSFIRKLESQVSSRFHVDCSGLCQQFSTFQYIVSRERFGLLSSHWPTPLA